MADKVLDNNLLAQLWQKSVNTFMQRANVNTIIELPNQYNRITDLAAGVYKLTYNGTKYIYYSGPVSSIKLTIASTNHIGPVILTVNKFDDLHWNWNYITVSDSTSFPTIYYGFSYSNSEKTSGGGIAAGKPLDSLITAHRYRPIQVNGTSILANTSSQALNLQNNGNVKFTNLGSGQVKADVDLSNYAQLKTANDFIIEGNEFNFIPDNFNYRTGAVWFNYQSPSRDSSATVRDYFFGDGRGNEIKRLSNLAQYSDVDTVLAVIDNSSYDLVGVNGSGRFKVYSWYEVAWLYLDKLDEDGQVISTVTLNNYGAGTWLFDFRGWGTYISTPKGTKISESGTDYCGYRIRTGPNVAIVYRLR